MPYAGEDMTIARGTGFEDTALWGKEDKGLDAYVRFPILIKGADGW